MSSHILGLVPPGVREWVRGSIGNMFSTAISAVMPASQSTPVPGNGHDFDSYGELTPADFASPEVRRRDLAL